MSAKKTVAVLGLGKMGSQIARNIVKTGFDVRVYNRTAEKAKPLVELGAVAAGSPAEAAKGADVVVTNFMDDASVLDNVRGDSGLLAGMAPGAVHVGTTTISPRCASELGQLHLEAGSHYVAGPVAGRPDSAEAGTLMTYVAGDADAIERCRPVLDSYSNKIIELGADPSVANSLKLLTNFYAISMIELLGQMYAFAEKTDIGVDRVRDLMPTLLAHPAIATYVNKIAERGFDEAGFTIEAGFKDVQLMLQTSTDFRVPLRNASLIREKFLTALADGMGDKDWSSIYEITRAEAGLA